MVLGFGSAFVPVLDNHDEVAVAGAVRDAVQFTRLVDGVHNERADLRMAVTGNLRAELDSHLGGN